MFSHLHSSLIRLHFSKFGKNSKKLIFVLDFVYCENGVFSVILLDAEMHCQPSTLTFSKTTRAFTFFTVIILVAGNHEESTLHFTAVNVYNA